MKRMLDEKGVYMWKDVGEMEVKQEVPKETPEPKELEVETVKTPKKVRKKKSKIEDAISEIEN